MGYFMILVGEKLVEFVEEGLGLIRKLEFKIAVIVSMYFIFELLVHFFDLFISGSLHFLFRQQLKTPFIYFPTIEIIKEFPFLS